MPSDTELFIERHTTYHELKDSEAALMLASNYRLSYDSVRGRLSRAATPANYAIVSKLQAKQLPDIPHSVERQLSVINDSNEQLAYHKMSAVGVQTGIFISDLHQPLHRFDAYELALTICDELKPNIISAQNDELDNSGYGVHDDSAPAFQRVWRGDFANARRMQRSYHSALRATLGKDGVLVGVMGNHDRWIYNHWRSKVPQTAERLVADYMEDLFHTDKVLQFSRGIHEKPVFINDGLVWVHGISAAANPTTIARNGFKRYMRDGRARSFVQGHTHRMAEVSGDTLGYHGVKFVNSGHLRHDKPDWLAHHPVNWGMGIVVCEYTGGWEHDIHLLRFKEVNNFLMTSYKGKEYSVGLDKTEFLHLS